MQYKGPSYSQSQRWHEKSINSALFNKAGAGHAFSTCARHLDPGYNYNNNYNSFASGHIYIAARKQQLSALVVQSLLIFIVGDGDFLFILFPESRGVVLVVFFIASNKSGAGLSVSQRMSAF